MSSVIARRGFAPLLPFMLAFCTAGTGAQAQGPEPEPDAPHQASVRVEPAVARPGDRVLLIIEVTSGGFGRLRPTPRFELENLEAQPGPPSRSESFEFVNGDSRRTLSLVWTLRAGAAGSARIHAIRVAIGQQVIELADQTVTIDPDAAPVARPTAPSPFSRPGALRSPLEDWFGGATRQRPARARGQPKVFLEAEIEPRRVTVGQQAVYTAYLYTQGDVSGVQPSNVPDFRGFWSRDIPQPESRRADMIERDGERFGRVVLLQKAIFPLAAGSYEFSPLRAQIALRVPVSGPFGGLASEIESLDRATPPLRLEVEALPPGAPEGFGGAVGQLRLDATLEPSDLRVGEAATFSLTLTGEGQFQGIADPELPALAGLRAFPPREESAEEIQGRTVRGRRVWRFVLIPEEAGVWNLPAIEIPYFDPVRRTYARAATSPLLLTAVVSPATMPATKDPTGEPGELDGARSSPSRIDPWRVLPWALAGLFGTAWLVALVRTRHLARAAAGSIGTAPGSSRPGNALPLEAANGEARRLFTERLEAAAREPRPRALAAGLEEAWRHYLEATGRLPAGVPLAQWGPRLADGVPRDLAHDLARLAEEIDYLRSAPQLSSSEALREEVLTRSRALAVRLRD